MNDHPPAIIRTLTFAGVIPFVMAPMMKAGWIAVPGTSPDIWLWSYAVVISAFMAGAQWGSALSRADTVSLVGSNVFALAVFALALWVQRPAGVLALAMLFAAQLLLDYRQPGLLAASLHDHTTGVPDAGDLRGDRNVNPAKDLCA